MGMAYDDNLRRTSYRVLKSQPAEPIVPRFPERALASDSSVFPAPLSIPPRAPEPAAFLTLDLEFGIASSTFLDATGRGSVQGSRLVDTLSPADREKVAALQRQIQDERKRKDPTYLPPMFAKEVANNVIQGLGFSSEEILRYPLEWQEYLTFLGQDGQARPFSARMGLAKLESIYFVVLLLNSQARAYLYPTPSPNPREITYAYPQAQQPYSQPTPVSATFDPRQPRPSESGYGARQVGPGVPPPMMSGLSPGLQSTYSASPGRTDYSHGPPYQTPRSELMPGSRPPQGAGYQLPPIRSQQPSTSQQHEMPYQAREERPRVDIGGLLDHPGPSKQPPSQQQ